MDHSILARYDRKIVRSALHQFLLQRLGVVFCGMFLLFGVFILFFDPWEPQSILRYVTTVIYLVAASLAVLVYFVRWKQSIATLSKMTHPEVLFTFSEHGVTWRSDLGSAELKWSIFDEVLKFQDVWLLIYSRSAYLTLPTRDLTNEVKVIIDRFCGKAG